MTTPPPRSVRPAFMDTADTFYGHAFGSDDRHEVEDSMAEWATLTDAERSFALGHLLYLNLRGQHANLRALTRLRILFEAIGERLDAMGSDVEILREEATATRYGGGLSSLDTEDSYPTHRPFERGDEPDPQDTPAQDTLARDTPAQGTPAQGTPVQDGEVHQTPALAREVRHVA